MKYGQWAIIEFIYFFLKLGPKPRHIPRVLMHRSVIQAVKKNMQITACFWLSSIHAVSILSVIFALNPPFLSTPEAISNCRRKQGVPLCKWLLHRLVTSRVAEEKGCVWKNTVTVKERHATERRLLSVVFLPNLTERQVGRVGLARSLVIFLYFSPSFFSRSPSLNRGQGPLGPALLCRRKIANPGYSDWTLKAGVL